MANTSVTPTRLWSAKVYVLSFVTQNEQVPLIVFLFFPPLFFPTIFRLTLKISLADMKYGCFFSAFVVKGGNVAVLCQKTPTRPMCSCSLLLYISTHTHTHKVRVRRIFQYTVRRFDARQRDYKVEDDARENTRDICFSSEITALFKCKKIVAAW